ncbi:MAG TPA: Rieske 2Fe-2S domain-containing protein [Candidatus Acidoferrales bacterium]|nr:Rieske 2Fe-2S domain-containing protein [Candidatus Acidoferrales bacterium]
MIEAMAGGGFRVIAGAEELADGTTKKFQLRCGGRVLEGILVKYAGAHYAYVNRCCHMPMPMDWVENRFFTEDGRYLICATHGAVYEPTTGECVWGPCCGGMLEVVPIAVANGKVLAYCPEGRA